MNRVTLYRLATALILGGFAMLCQPWSLNAFSAGFPVIVFGVVLHIVLDHWPERHLISDNSDSEQ